MELERPHSTVEVKENVEPDSTRIEDAEVLFGVPPMEVAIFDKPKYKVRIGIRDDRSIFHFNTCLVATGAGPNLINEAYQRRH